MINNIKQIYHIKITWFGYLLIFLVLFISNLLTPSDPDFGWHLRYGQEITTSQTIPLKDTFSNSFYGMSITDSEWLSDVVSYLLYAKTSLSGFVVYWALITTLAVILPFLWFKTPFWVAGILALGINIGIRTVSIVGGRSQNLGWLMISFLTILILSYINKAKIKYLFLLALLFLFWTNMHPSYYLGLLLIAIAIVIHSLHNFWLSLKDHKALRSSSFFNTLKMVGFFFLIYTITLLRPKAGQFSNLFSFDLIKAVLFPLDFAVGSSEKGIIRISIMEWMSPYFLNISGLVFFLSYLGLLAFLNLQKISRQIITNIAFVLFGVYFATLSRRNIPIFYFIALPVFANLLNFKDFQEKAGRKILSVLTTTVFIILSIFFVYYLKGFSFEYRNFQNLDSYFKNLKYPTGAVNFLKNNHLNGNMLNHYNWGGFLIWQLPEYPVFVDGRIPEYPIYYEYKKFESNQAGWEEIISKYHLTFALLPKSITYERMMLEDLKWQKKYEDEISVIYSQ